MGNDQETNAAVAAPIESPARPRPMLDRGHRAVSSRRHPHALLTTPPVASARRQRFARLICKIYLFAIMVLVLTPFAVGLFTIAYVIKRALGIDFFPEFHLTDWLE